MDTSRYFMLFCQKNRKTQGHPRYNLNAQIKKQRGPYAMSSINYSQENNESFFSIDTFFKQIWYR
ncbi:hypothetical protein PTL465_04880 [Ligilactobacillus agilis]|nr:hypothetical protein PTL465_04880 [Ligilactobacillus agilis]